MPKIVTPESRRAEAVASIDAIKSEAAILGQGRPPADIDWTAVAKHAGELQRRARQLAGLGRGG